MLTQFIAFLGISALVIVTPGQDTALTIRNALLGGRKSGAFTALGVSAGQAVWTIATSAGLAALLVASEPAFLAVKLAGAAYLIFLGVQALASAFSSRRSAATAGAPVGRRGTPWAGFRQGFISNLGNPKMAVFFTSLLPQFSPGGNASLAALLLLGFVFCLMTLGWLTGYAIAVAKAGGFLRRPRIRRTIDAVTGVVFVAFGLRLATERG